MEIFTACSKKTEDGDVIIAWIFRYAISVAVLNKILRKPINIVGLNFIDHSVGWKVKIKELVYDKIFQDSNFHMSVNCIEFLDKYMEKYKIDKKRVFELQDCNYFETPIHDFSEGDNSIFCGGNIRDWKCILILKWINFMIYWLNVVFH